MREIKFRAWHIVFRQMLTRDEWYHYGPNLVHGELKSDNCIIMQYTGLKDKNGKEIYEGDILGWDDKSGCPWVVIWETMFDHSTWGASHSEAEIIGNIYENPELINEAR